MDALVSGLTQAVQSRLTRLFSALWFVVCGLVCVFAQPVVADDAAVLPKGIARLHWDLYLYHPTTQRYNADGKREDLASPFTNAALDSRVLPLLSPLDTAVGGVASIGEVSVDYEYGIEVLDFGFSYGVTDDLSVGLHMPYYWISNDVNTAFDTTSANVGLNPGAGPELIPLAAGGVPLTNDDVQNLIVGNYGFDAIDSWQREGIGDIELGAKYRIHQGPSSALAITGGVRFPTGYEDDPDLLNDVAWSFGTEAVLMRLHFDYLLSRHWSAAEQEWNPGDPAAGDVVLNLTLRVDYMLPDEKLMRIGDTPEQTLTNNRERVSRELGNMFNLEASLYYHATSALTLGATYTYGFKEKDDIDGDLGYNYASLEADTDSMERVVIVSASYSTLDAFRRKQSTLPMEFTLAYRERFDGEGPSSGQANPKLDTRWLVAGLRLFF